MGIRNNYLAYSLVSKSAFDKSKAFAFPNASNFGEAKVRYQYEGESKTVKHYFEGTNDSHVWSSKNTRISVIFLVCLLIFFISIE